MEYENETPKVLLCDQYCRMLNNFNMRALRDM
jgi:hypothetical protein